MKSNRIHLSLPLSLSLTLSLSPILTLSCSGSAASGDTGGEIAVGGDVAIPGDGLAADAGADADRDAIADTPAEASGTEAVGPADGIAPGADVVGGCQECAYGTLVGLTCAPDGATPVPEVTVAIDAFDCAGNPIHLETTSDAKGRYTIENVPCGLQTVALHKGSFDHEYSVFVDAGMETTATNGRCFGAQAARIAVVSGDWDQIQYAVLDKLKLKYTEYGGVTNDYGSGYEQAVDLLTDPNELAKYDVIFINCSDSAGQIVSSYGGTLKKTLDDFVKNGGSMYLSDYAADYIMNTWPTYVQWGGHDVWGHQKVIGEIIDPPLFAYLGNKSTVEIQYGLGPLQGVYGVDPATTMVHVQGFFKQDQYNDTLPMMVSFKPYPKGGRVVYTNFHNDEQTGQALLDLKTILNFVVFML